MTELALILVSFGLDAREAATSPASAALLGFVPWLARTAKAE